MVNLLPRLVVLLTGLLLFAGCQWLDPEQLDCSRQESCPPWAYCADSGVCVTGDRPPDSPPGDDDDATMNPPVGDDDDSVGPDDDYTWTRWKIADGAHGETFYSVSFADASNGWVVGTNGIILHSENGGEDWQIQTRVTGGPTLLSVFFVDANNGWAVGSNATVLWTGNGGEEWHTSPIDVEGDILGVHAVNISIVYLVTQSGEVWISQSAGDSWQHLTDSPTQDLLTGISGSNEPSPRAWAVGHNDDSNNNGTFLQVHGDPGTSPPPQDDLFGRPHDVAVLDQRGWVVGDSSKGGYIQKTEDGGLSWLPPVWAEGDGSALKSVDFTSPSLRGWAVGDNHLVMTTTNGNDWRAIELSFDDLDLGQDDTLYGVDFFDDDLGWVVGTNSLILKAKRSNQSGDDDDMGGPLPIAHRWIRGNVPASANGEDLRSVSLFSASLGWAVGTNGTILMTANGGLDWNSQTHTAQGVELNSVFFLGGAASLSGWIVGAGGVVLRTTDGVNWLQSNPFENNPRLNDVYAIDENHVVVVTDTGSVYSSNDGGVDNANWSKIGESEPRIGQEKDRYPLHAVSASDEDPSRLWSVGAAGTFMQLFPTEIHSEIPGMEHRDVVVMGQRGWLVGNESEGSLNGYIMTTQTGGDEWSEQATSTTSLNGLDFLGSTHGWAVGNRHTVMATGNAGEGWHEFDLQPFNLSLEFDHHLYDVDFINEDFGCAVGKRGLILVAQPKFSEGDDDDDIAGDDDDIAGDDDAAGEDDAR